MDKFDITKSFNPEYATNKFIHPLPPPMVDIDHDMAHEEDFMSEDMDYQPDEFGL